MSVVMITIGKLLSVKVCPKKGIEKNKKKNNIPAEILNKCCTDF
jgi:hypothetical protein